jgi:hypothetical protein
MILLADSAAWLLRDGLNFRKLMACSYEELKYPSKAPVDGVVLRTQKSKHDLFALLCQDI